MSDAPPTRWQLAGGAGGHAYGRAFADLIAAGRDVDGEARLADALLPRAATVLDAGSGMGRVAAALQARGHRVVGVEADADLVAQSREAWPAVPVVGADLVHTTPDLLAGEGHPTAYDLVVAVGNVMVYLAEGTERTVLGRMRDLLAPGGRVLVGFHLRETPTQARHYPPEEFVGDVEAVGLQVELRAGSYELHPPGDEYAVWLLGRAGT